MTKILRFQCIYKETRNSEEFTGSGKSLTPPPSPFSSLWFLVTCYGQFALPVCKELNVCVLQVTDFYGI